MTSHESPEPRSRAVAGAASLLALAVVCFAISAAPFVIAVRVGLGWGVLAGIALPLAWMLTMPTTCFNGGLLWSMLGVQQFMLLCVWVVRGAVLVVTTVL